MAAEGEKSVVDEKPVVLSDSDAKGPPNVVTEAIEDEDMFLYGSDGAKEVEQVTVPLQPPVESADVPVKAEIEATPVDIPAAVTENGTSETPDVKPEEEGDAEEDSDDEDVDIIIGTQPTADDVKQHTAGQAGVAPQLQKKAPAAPEKPAAKKLDIDQPAFINGQPIYEYKLEDDEDKPWRKPGADLTDYFNYGFTEDTWRTYCERQKTLRLAFPDVGTMRLLATQGNPTGPIGTIVNPHVSVASGGSNDRPVTPTGDEKPPRVMPPQMQMGGMPMPPPGFPHMMMPGMFPISQEMRLQLTTLKQPIGMPMPMMNFGQGPPGMMMPRMPLRPPMNPTNLSNVNVNVKAEPTEPNRGRSSVSPPRRRDRRSRTPPHRRYEERDGYRRRRRSRSRDPRSRERSRSRSRDRKRDRR